MNRITINGKTITCSGTNVVINNGKVIVDGKTIQRRYRRRWFCNLW